MIQIVSNCFNGEFSSLSCRVRLRYRTDDREFKFGAGLGRSGVSLVPAGPGRSTGRTKVRRVVAPAGRQGISPRCSATAYIVLPLHCLVLPFASLPASSPRRFAVCQRDGQSYERDSFKYKYVFRRFWEEGLAKDVNLQVKNFNFFFFKERLSNLKT